MLIEPIAEQFLTSLEKTMKILYLKKRARYAEILLKCNLTTLQIIKEVYHENFQQKLKEKNQQHGIRIQSIEEDNMEKSLEEEFQSLQKKFQKEKAYLHAVEVEGKQLKNSIRETKLENKYVNSQKVKVLVSLDKKIKN